MSRRLRSPLLALLAAALALPALGQSPPPAPPDTRSQALRDAERDLWIPGRSRALRGWLVKAAPTALANEAALAPAAPGEDGWAPYAAWTDVVELSAPADQAAPGAPADPNAGPRYLYAATIGRPSPGGTGRGRGRRRGAGAGLGQWRGCRRGVRPTPLLARDRVRLPVRLRQGANRILLRAEQVAGPSRLTIRLLAPGQPMPETFTPFVTEAPGRLHVDTDLGPRQGVAQVAALRAGRAPGRAARRAARHRAGHLRHRQLARRPLRIPRQRDRSVRRAAGRLAALVQGRPDSRPPAACSNAPPPRPATMRDSGHWRMLGAL